MNSTIGEVTTSDYDKNRHMPPYVERGDLAALTFRSVGGEPVTTSELARALGLSLRSVQRYIRAGQITPVLTTPGGHHRWDVEDVRRQLRELRRRADES